MTTFSQATLDRRFQGVSNTMESIQGLSTWCIENKKYHSLIVRYWMKWLKKCEPIYLANVITHQPRQTQAKTPYMKVAASDT
uniref:CID domain-containing protein n=1 Tax=Hucho hucho TaxID=62062 RepID=A0A4W5RXB8_9TELE